MFWTQFLHSNKRLAKAILAREPRNNRRCSRVHTCLLKITRKIQTVSKSNTARRGSGKNLSESQKSKGDRPRETMARAPNDGSRLSTQSNVYNHSPKRPKT